MHKAFHKCTDCKKEIPYTEWIYYDDVNRKEYCEKCYYKGEKK